MPWINGFSLRLTGMKPIRIATACFMAFFCLAVSVYCVPRGNDDRGWVSENGDQVAADKEVDADKKRNSSLTRRGRFRARGLGIYEALESTRKGLKRMRKWRSAHQPEINLISCINNYIDDDGKFTGRFYNDDDGDDDYAYDEEDDRSDDKFQVADVARMEQRGDTKEKGKPKGKVLEREPQKKNNSSNLSASSDSDEFPERPATSKTHILIDFPWQMIRSIHKSVRWIQKNNPLAAKDLFANKAIQCCVDYAFLKFWQWIDAAQL